MRKRIALLAGSGAVLIAAAGYSASGVAPPASTVYESRTIIFEPAPEASVEDRRQALSDWVNGHPLDVMWVEKDAESHVRADSTHIRKFQTGETLHVITVTDEIPDLDVAELYVDSVLTATATWGNGGITDNGNGTATATLNMWKPKNGTHTYEVIWTDPAALVSKRHYVTD